MFPCSYRPFRNTRLYSHFRLRKVSLNPFQKQVITQGFDIDGNELAGTESLLEMAKIDQHCSVCNTQQLTQPPLALSVPLSRFTSRVGGGSAFFVRHQATPFFWQSFCTEILVARKSATMRRDFGWIGFGLRWEIEVSSRKIRLAPVSSGEQDFEPIGSRALGFCELCYFWCLTSGTGTSRTGPLLGCETKSAAI
jgi:hypothetical protein